MKRIEVRFERDMDLDHIDVLVRASERDSTVTRLMEDISGQPPDSLTVTDTEGMTRRIVTDDLIAVSVRDKLTLLTTEDGRYTVRQPLQNMERALDPGRFLRISRHELINRDKIERFEFMSNGTLRLELTGGIETWVARRCIPEVRSFIKGKG